jgi:peptidoglycan/LPS O-acetylase OafA/YrhL
MMAAHAAESEDGRRHIPALDGVRGVAVLIVMQFHFYALTFYVIGTSPSNPVDRFVGRIVGVGWSGVDLFFVLSGFLITGILWDAKQTGGYFRNFYARRALRILPVYFGFLAFLVLVVSRIDTLAGPARIDLLLDHQWSYWVFMSNITGSVRWWGDGASTGFAHFWSLAVEEQFYLVWPAVVLLLGRRSLIALCCLMVPAAFAVRLYLNSAHASDYFLLNAGYVLVVARMDTLALGALIAMAFRSPGAIRQLAAYAPIVGLAALAVLAALFTKNDGISIFEANVRTWGFLAFALLYASIMVIVLNARAGSTLASRLSPGWLRAAGRYSYAMYVVHPFIAIQMTTRFVDAGLAREVLGSQIPANLAFNFVCTVLTFAAGWLSWTLYERHFLKLKRWFRAGEREVLAAPLPAGVPVTADP